MKMRSWIFRSVWNLMYWKQLTFNRKVIDIQNTADCKISKTQNAVSFKAKTPFPVFSRLKVSIFLEKKDCISKWKSWQVLKADPGRAAWSPDTAMRLTPINSKDQINASWMMQCTAFWHCWCSAHIVYCTCAQESTYYLVAQHCDSRL